MIGLKKQCSGTSKSVFGNKANRYNKRTNEQMQEHRIENGE